MLTPKIFVVDQHDYCLQATKIIAGMVDEAIHLSGKCGIMLTGGRTAKKLYRSWAEDTP
jgi:6-phosphogluconolactonase/glucosamine-6-phosphate isomerase/deaminase